MRLLFITLLFISSVSCSKSKNEAETETCLVPNWLDRIKAEYSSCVCLTAIFQSTYNGKTVYEVRGIDPRCDGINSVYSAEGVNLFVSSPDSEYKKYLETTKDIKKIWSCDEVKRN